MPRKADSVVGKTDWPGAREGAKFADVVARQIRSDVVARGWPVGAVIGTEPELLERFGASRATLREALRIVEYLGIARMRQGPGGGLVVMAPDSSAITFAAVIYLAYSRVSVEEVLGARRVIEELAVDLAVAAQLGRRTAGPRRPPRRARGAAHRARHPLGAARAARHDDPEPGGRGLRPDPQPADRAVRRVRTTIAGPGDPGAPGHPRRPCPHRAGDRRGATR